MTRPLVDRFPEWLVWTLLLAVSLTAVSALLHLYLGSRTGLNRVVYRTFQTSGASLAGSPGGSGRTVVARGTD